MNSDSIGLGITENKPKAKTPALTRENIINMYTEYAGSLYNYFYYSLGERTAAEDLVSDVFVKIIDKRKFYNAEKGKLKVWLFTVARNTLRDYLKSNRRKKNGLALDEIEELPAASHNTPEKSAELKQEIQALNQAMKILSERERGIISLKYGAGLRNKDIAKMLFLTEKNVSVILCRTLTKLKAKLKNQLGDDFYD